MKKPKPMTFWVSAKSGGPRPKFSAVVDQIYRQYAKRRGNIVGTTLCAPDGTTGRQMTLALARARERWASRSQKTEVTPAPRG